MPVVGALARIDREYLSEVKSGLTAHHGVTTFDVGVPEKLGILIESESLDDARALLEKKLPLVDGILSVRPVYANFEDDLEV